MKYYSVDVDNWEWTECASEEEAVSVSEETIQYYRENCDPEWGMGVDDVVVVFGERDEDAPEYDGCKVLWRAKEFDRVDFTPEEAEENGCDYYCDYRMEKA